MAGVSRWCCAAEWVAAQDAIPLTVKSHLCSAPILRMTHWLCTDDTPTERQQEKTQLDISLSYTTRTSLCYIWTLTEAHAHTPANMSRPEVSTRMMRGFVMMSSCLLRGGLCITNGSTVSTPRLWEILNSVMLCDVVWCCVMFCHMVWCHIMLYNVSWC